MARLNFPEEIQTGGDGLTFLFSKGGAGKFTSKTATHRLLPGDILVFNGAAGSRLAVWNKQGEFLYRIFTTCFENLLPLFGSNEISLLHNITEGFKAGKVYPASSTLAAECQSLLGLVPPQFSLDHRGQLVRIAATILSVEFKEGQLQRSGHVRTDDRMMQTFEKLSASELINLSVDDLAARFSCSRRHLNRLFHQHFGASVTALRMEMRLLKAISLLRDADIKIINVADQCGFNHLGLFNTCFKRRFGTSPGRWRRSGLEPVAASVSGPEKTPSRPPGGKPERLPSSVMSTIAGKIVGGADILEDLNRRDLTFGAQALSKTKHGLSATRAGG